MDKVLSELKAFESKIMPCREITCSITNFESISKLKQTTPKLKNFFSSAKNSEEYQKSQNEIQKKLAMEIKARKIENNTE